MKVQGTLVLLTAIAGGGCPSGVDVPILPDPAGQEADVAPRAPFEGKPPIGSPDTPAAPRPLLGSTLDQDTVLARLRDGAPRRFRAVGTTSTVFEMHLDGPLDAAFKVPTPRDPHGYLGEVAAYRIARFLGMDNVPPATVRRIPRATLEALEYGRPRGGWAALERRLTVQPDGSLLGAAIYWIPDLKNFYLERPSRMQRWTRHLLLSGYVPVRERSMYRDISTMLAFDYLIGNWDRFSGSNTQGTPDQDRLWVRDHNAAFTQLRAFDRHDRILRHLRRAERFSASFVRNLIRLDERTVRAEFAEEEARAGQPLLNDNQIRELLDRREALISYVASLADSFGRERILVFD